MAMLFSYDLSLSAIFKEAHAPQVVLRAVPPPWIRGPWSLLLFMIFILLKIIDICCASERNVNAVLCCTRKGWAGGTRSN